MFETPISKLVTTIEGQINHSSLMTSKIGKSIISLESIDTNERNRVNDTYEGLTVAIEAIASEMGYGPLGGSLLDDNKQPVIGFTRAQRDAAAIAAMLSSDYPTHMSRSLALEAVSSENLAVVQSMTVADSAARIGMEAYDERESRNATIYSIAYNMQSARQDEFGETLFPTLVITPDNVGFGVTINLMLVYDAIERRISGDVTDFMKKNLIRAAADPTILKKEQTRIIPVHIPQSADKFVDPAIVAPIDMLLEGETIHTAPLAIGKKFDLLGLSQTEALLSTGIMDMTDTIDPAVKLQSIYVKIGDDVLKFNTSNLPYSEFVYSTQQNYRLMQLNFTTNSMRINKATKNVDGSALTTLGSVITNDLIIRMEVNMSGTINIELGDTSVFGNMVSAFTVADANGNLLALDAAPAAAIVNAIKTATIVGYDLLAYRTNTNRRQRGQLIDVTRYTQLYNVPLRSPITAIHPATVDGQTDAADVQALIATTRRRVSNEAVTSLLNASSILKEYVDARDYTNIGPDVLGVSRYLVRPVYQHEAIDVNAIVDSLTSSDRSGDLQAALVNKIRDHVYQAYRDSEYPAAADTLAGGLAPVPTVVIATDPVLARYLTVSGDFRTLGNEFQVRIVHTLDRRMKGKIIATFGVFDESRNTSPNPMNFGNMVWAPELVLTANITRGGAYSRETVVQPRYLFVTHLPIMIDLEVTNVPDIWNKVTVNVNQNP